MQRNNRYQIKQLEWDTNFFGISSAKVILKDEINMNDLLVILKDLKDNNYKFITIQNNNNNDNNNLIIKELNNVFLSDVNIQFIKNIEKNTKSSELVDDIRIQNSMPYNEDIINISNKSFKYSRFTSDKNLKNGDKVYSEWTKNSFDKEDKFFCFYTINNIVVGYLLFSLEKEELTIELIAVDNNYKGKGIGHKLINKIDEFSKVNEIKNVKVGTQLNNIKAQNFYISCGFKHITNNSIYHMWL